MNQMAGTSLPPLQSTPSILRINDHPRNAPGSWGFSAADQEPNPKVAGAELAKLGSTVYEAMPEQLLKQFLEYFDREESTQIKRMTSWYDAKIKRLTYQITQKEKSMVSMVSPPQKLISCSGFRSYLQIQMRIVTSANEQ